MSFSLRFVCSIVWRFFTENSNLAESGIPGKFNPDSGVADREQSVVHYRVKIQKCHYCVMEFSNIGITSHLKIKWPTGLNAGSISAW